MSEPDDPSEGSAEPENRETIKTVRDQYEDLLNAPIPERLLRLIEKLREKEKKR